jgi:hypothetical protein
VVELAIGGGLRVGLEDACLRLDDLAQRPERDSLPVREATALLPPHVVRTQVEDRLELVQEPALTGARLSDDRHQLDGLGADRAIKRVDQHGALRIAADERSPVAFLDGNPLPGPGAGGEPDGRCVGLALEIYRLEVVVGDDIARSQVGALIDDDATGWGDGFEAGRRVDHIADDGLPVLVISVELDDGLAGGDRYPHRKGEIRVVLVEALDRLLEADGGSHRSLRVVLVGGWHPEDGKDTVTHQLLDAAAVSLHLLAGGLVIDGEPGPHILWVGSLGALGEARQVG